MEERAQQALAQLLERAVSGIDATVAFSQAQIPDVVQQLLLWHTVHSVLWSLLAVALLIPPIFGYRWVIRAYRQGDLDGNDAMFAAVMGGIVTVLILVTSLVIFDLSWLKIMLAPKLYLLEYAAELVK